MARPAVRMGVTTFRKRCWCRHHSVAQACQGHGSGGQRGGASVLLQQSQPPQTSGARQKDVSESPVQSSKRQTEAGVVDQRPLHGADGPTRYLIMNIPIIRDSGSQLPGSCSSTGRQRDEIGVRIQKVDLEATRLHPAGRKPKPRTHSPAFVDKRCGDKLCRRPVCRRICCIHLTLAQSVAMDVQSKAKANTFSSTGRCGLKLERINEHKSHNPFYRTFDRSPDDPCHQWRHAVHVQFGGSGRLCKQRPSFDRRDAGNGQRRGTSFISR